jgi:hypothetical protein
MSSPTWHSGITQDTWGVLPNSDLNASGVMAAAGASAVVNKWGGGIVCTGGLYLGSTFTTGTFFVIWGGGHTDYSGNEVYAYGPLENNSPTWNILRNPTSPVPTDVETDGSGNPSSRHTYNTICYVNDGTRNWLVSMGSLFTYIASNSYDHVLSYNFGQVSPNSNQPWATHAILFGAADVCAYESSSGRIWYHTNATNQVGYYDIATNTDTSSIYKSPVGYGSNAASCIDTSRGIWALWDGSNGISFYRTNNGVGNDYYVPTTTGTAPTVVQGSIVYDSANDCFWLWLGNGKEIWKLKAPGTSPYQGGNAWTWSHATPGTGSTPDAQNTNGTFGRFNRTASVDFPGMPLMNAYNGTMYFYKSGPSVAASGTIRRNAILNGLGASGKFFNNPLG